MARHKYFAKDGASAKTASPVWAEEVGSDRAVRVGKNKDGSPKYAQAKTGDMVFTADLHDNTGVIMAKAEFEATYNRMA